MREILFRGRDDKGRWREGSLIVVRVEKPTHKDIKPYEAYIIKEQAPDGEEYLVDHKTVGQLVSPATELHPDIWEGDIIEICGNDPTLAQRTVIEWNKHQAGFVVLLTNPSNGDKGYCPLSLVFLDLQGEDALAIKVIGNIHDNPELINDLNREDTKKV